MLTFEQSPFLGTANIVTKLQVRDIHHDRETQRLCVIVLAGQEWLIRNVNTGTSLPAHRAPDCYRRRAAQQRERWYPCRCQRRTPRMTHPQFAIRREHYN
jgi:hypothetical protein